jgi:acyl-CoA reductase-like NAD-dependent aldehyde dehydrogenase
MPRDATYEIPAKYDLFIGNGWVEPSSTDVLESRSPLTDDLLCTVPDANEVDVANAVQAAKAAWRGWFALGARKRANLLLQVADRLEADVDRFAWLETTDTGKPWRESKANVHTAADRLRYFAGVVRGFDGRTQPVGRNILSMDLREPLGVVGIMGAWNFPLNMFAGKIAPALAVGNAVVYKAPEPTPITTFELARLMGEILPPGVINVVSGRGETAGAALVAHSDVRKISLTGSSATGRIVMSNAGKSLKRVTLELGGKNAQIVYGDADLNAAAQGVMLGAFMNQGQVCTSGSRIFAHRSIADELRDRVVGLIPKLRVGDPFDPQTNMGSMVYRAHLDGVLDYIERGRAEGGEVIEGGGRLQITEFPKGLFIQPTLFGSVEDDMTVAREEIFGPVATFHLFDDEDEVIGRANALDYGLAAGIWSEDLGRAHRTAQAIEAGRVWVNCYNLFPSGSAFGGTKASGFGREDAFETMLDFTQVKNVIMDYAPSRRSFYD